MFFSLNPTPYDVSFRVFGISVRVHPSYWLIVAFFTFDITRAFGVGAWILAIACLFISIMAHELGHALLYRAFHMWSMIVLSGFCGLTIPEGRLPVRTWRIIVILGGPLANFLLLGLVWGSNELYPWAIHNVYTMVAYLILFSVNLYWGLINLLPVWPLDGGQISRELWTKYQPRMGLINSLRMSFIVAIAFSIYAIACTFNLIPPEWTNPWVRPGIFAAVFFALFAVMNWTELQQARQMQSFRADDRLPWER